MEPALQKHENILDHPQVRDDELAGDQKTIHVDGSCENINTKPSSSKIDSLSKNGADSPDSSQKNEELTTTMCCDSEKLPSTDDSCSKITTCSKTEANDHMSGTSSYTNTTSSLSLSSSSVKHNSPETEKSSSVSVAEENSSISESPSSDTAFETLSCSSNPENVFFQKGKIYSSNIQAYQEVELETNVSTPTPAERHDWVLMNRKFIQKEGYRLGIKPGTFYSSSKGYFVEMLNGSNYEIILTNENPVPCNVEVYVDNQKMPVICFRLRPDKPLKFDGPTFCENKFVFLRSKDAPLRSGINPASTSNGIIQAVFTPQKVENVRSRTVSEPIPFSRNVTRALSILGIKTDMQKPRSYTASSPNAERGIDITNFCQGATALRGEQTPKTFQRAEAMETDDTRKVVLILRLIARTDEPSIISEEDICSIFPPSVEEILES